jgi:hypothetical protein
LIVLSEIISDAAKRTSSKEYNEGEAENEGSLKSRRSNKSKGSAGIKINRLETFKDSCDDFGPALGDK